MKFLNVKILNKPFLHFCNQPNIGNDKIICHDNIEKNGLLRSSNKNSELEIWIIDKHDLTDL